MSGGSRWPAVIVAFAVGLTAGGLAGAALLIGPGGYRPQNTVAIQIPSPSPTSAPATRPVGRTGAAMAFDVGSGKIVLFGGYVSRGTYHEFGDPIGDTWTWDGDHWTQVQISNSPAPRYSATMTNDAARRDIVLHGGLLANQAAVNDTWTWSGGRWLQTSPNVSPPSEGGPQPMCWDTQSSAVILYSGLGQQTMPGSVPTVGQMWTWDGATWTQLSPAQMPSGFEYQPANLTCDTARKSVVLFGHATSGPSNSVGTPVTWTFDGGTWTQVASPGSASLTFLMAPDDARSTIVLFGENGDTWTWNGARWNVQNPVHSPPARVRASMAYDATHRVVVLFGGSTGSAAALHELNDTWTWNGSDWTQVLADSAPRSPTVPAPPSPSPR